MPGGVCTEPKEMTLALKLRKLRCRQGCARHWRELHGPDCGVKRGRVTLVDCLMPGGNYGHKGDPPALWYQGP